MRADIGDVFENQTVLHDAGDSHWNIKVSSCYVILFQHRSLAGPCAINALRRAVRLLSSDRDGRFRSTGLKQNR